MTTGSRPCLRQSATVHGERGVTLVELLVAMAIGSLVLMALVGLLSSARAGERSLTRGVEPRQALALAAELLREEIALSGFVPWGNGSGALLAPEDGLLESAGARLVVSGAGTPNHAIRIAFVDDRLVSGTLARDLTFSTGVDGRGAAQLYRRTGTASRQPLVEGIAALQVTAFIDDTGLHDVAAPSGGPLSHAAVWALLLELTAPTGEARTLVVELPSRPGLVVGP